MRLYANGLEYVVGIYILACESRGMGFIKNVDILDGTIDKQVSFFRNNIGPLICSQWGKTWDIASVRGYWHRVKESGRRWFQFGAIQLHGSKRYLHPGVGDATVAPSVVFDRDTYRRPSGLVHNFEILKCEMSTFYDLRRFFLLLGNPGKNPCKPDDKYSSNGSQKTGVIIKTFSDMPEKDKRRVISGAIFLTSILVFFAYLCIGRNKR